VGDSSQQLFCNNREQGLHGQSGNKAMRRPHPQDGVSRLRTIFSEPQPKMACSSPWAEWVVRPTHWGANVFTVPTHRMVRCRPQMTTMNSPLRITLKVVLFLLPQEAAPVKGNLPRLRMLTGLVLISGVGMKSVLLKNGIGWRDP